jgi:hypothetical protein
MRHCRITNRPEPPASPRLNCMLDDVEKNVMKALLDLGRTGVIEAVAVVAVAVVAIVVFR